MDRETIKPEVEAIVDDILGSEPDPEHTDDRRFERMPSLTAARLWVALELHFDVELPLQVLPGVANVDDLCDLLLAAGSATTPKPEAVAAGTLLPLQEAYLMGADPDLTPDPVGCREYLELTMPGLDVERLADAWAALGERHQALRAAVTPDGELRPDSVGVRERLRIERCAEPGSVASGRARVRAGLTGPMDAGAAHTAATVVVTVDPDGDAVVHLSFDMVLLDGFSVELLLAEWGALYEQQPLPVPPPASLPDALHRLAAASAVDTAEIEHLRDAALDRLRATAARRSTPPAPAGQRRESIGGLLCEPEWRAVREWADARGISPSSAVLAAFCASQIRALGGGVAAAVTLSRRPWLPSGADVGMGPFTSSVTVVADQDRDLSTLAASLHDQVWQGLANPGLSSVDIARAARRLDAERAARGDTGIDGVATLGAVGLAFTSLLDATPQSQPHPWTLARHVTHAVVETSGVAVDCQVWAEDGGLRYRWDVADPDAWPAPVAFAAADFANSLRRLTLAPVPLAITPTALQESYVVARAEVGEPPGCQTVYSFDIPETDLAHLDAAVGTWLAAYQLLGVRLTADGAFTRVPRMPSQWSVPVVRAAHDRSDPDRVHESVRDRLLTRGFALDDWPMVAVAASVHGRHAQLHVALDIAVIDAPWGHYLARELVRVLSGARPMGRLFGPPADVLDQRRDAPPAASSAHWRERMAGLDRRTTGRRTPAASGASSKRYRLSGRLSDLRGLRRVADQAGCSVDALMLAAFATACAEQYETAVPVTVVRWGDEPHPTGLTRLSWVVADHPAGSLVDLAIEMHGILAEDRAADEVEGLRPMRRRALRSDTSPVSLVFTCDVDVTRWRLPAGYRLDRWASATPGVHLDAVSLSDVDCLSYAWDVDPAAFPDGWAEAAFARYASLLRGLAAGTQAPPPPRGALDRAEYRQIVHAFNRTRHRFAESRAAHEAFEDIAAIRPDRVAVVTATGQVTYGELNAWADRIADRLHALGVRSGDRVAVGCTRGAAMVAAVFGVLKATAAYVPVEPDTPAIRVRSMLDQTAAAIVLIDQEDAPWPQLDIEQVDVRPLWSNGEGGVRRPARQHPHGLAYVIFTSGSTGAPKGVAVTHRAVANLLDWCWRTYGFDEDDYGLGVASLGFDLSVFDLFGLLGVGARLYVASASQRRDPAVLHEILGLGITFWNSAPTALAQLQPLMLDPAVAVRPDLRLVFLSGDYTPLELPAALRRNCPHATLVSLGGATEATVWSNVFEVEHVDPAWRSIPYGRPIANARYYVLDEDLAPCRRNVEGDLYIAGECLSLGYWGASGLTASAFVADPHADVPGTRMYRTGDRAYLGTDGQLVFAGRADHQVKIRGYRVELAEIEHHVRACAGVRDVVVLSRRDHAGDTKLVAYLTADPSATVTAAEVRRHCAGALPEYMVPNHVVRLAAFPATANGKLDRDALPWPVPADDHPLAPPGPATATLADLLATFEAVLGYPIDPDADIWDQGATSFTLVRVSQQAERAFGRRIRLADVLREPTARAMHASLTGASPVAEALAQTETNPGVGTATATASEAEPVDFFSATSRAAFKSEHRNRRPVDPRALTVSLSPPHVAAQRRRSVRDLLDTPVSATVLSELLAALAPVDGRYRYPSAGDTYGVQVYLLVRDRRVDGLPGGTYYYRPEAHRLERVGYELPREAHFYYNRDLFERSAFEIYLIGALDSIEPLYGENAARYLAIEAGCAIQMLQDLQSSLGLGLCTVGEIQPAYLAGALGLDDRHVFLSSLLGGVAERSTVDSVDDPAPAARPSAIIGLTARLPGGDERGLVDLLTSAGSGLGPGRPGGIRATGGWLDAVDAVDLDLLGLTPVEAAQTDPQLLLGMESVHSALQQAGYSGDQFARSAGRVGVFVACMWHDFEHGSCDPDTPSRTGSIGSDICQRISHHFGFEGPSVTVDAGCCSTLTAIHLARNSIALGECSAAVVVGVNLLLHRHHLDLLREWHLAAPDGTTAPAFSATASGWVPAEAVGAIVLRPLDEALAARDTVRAIIESSHAGHPGGGGRFESPAIAGMASSIEATLVLAGRTPGDVGYVECAAAGSAMADTAEIEALARVFADAGAETIPVGSVKSTLGHAEAASGIAQMVRVVAQLRDGTVLPTPTAGELNPMVPWEHLPLRIPQVAEPLSTTRPITLVQGFAAGGGFGHLAVRAPDRPAGRRSGQPDSGAARAVVLSGATRDQLVDAAREFASWLNDPRQRGTSIDDLAFTTQRARASLPWRWGCAAHDTTELAAALAAFLAEPDTRGAPAVPAVPAMPTVPAMRAGHAPIAREGVDDAERLALWLRGGLTHWAPETAGGALIEIPPLPLRRVRVPSLPGGEREIPDVPSDIPSDVVDDAFAEATGRRPHEGELDAPLEASPLSSFTLVRLSRALSDRGLPVPTSTFFAHRTLREAIASAVPKPTVPAPSAPRIASPIGGDIAIVGMAGRFPGADDVDAFWRLLRDGVDATGPMPAQRREPGWPEGPLHGGFLRDVDAFDAGFFGITPRDADLMDPQERLFLQVSWHALEDAGYPPARLAARHRGAVGVFASTMYDDYSFIGVEERTRGRLISTGSSTAGIANRVSFALNLTGPSMTVDTMCSASLTAVHLACRSLRDGECEVALAGGINLITHPMRFIEQGQLGMTSAAGRCQPFGAGADGMVPGEGVGVLVLKPLAQALADGDRVLTVIKGTAVGHTGRTNGYMVPDPVSEAAVMFAALRDAGLDPSDVGYVETHGTGTRLGDPIEVDAVNRVLGPTSTPRPIGSVKSNIGHLEGAAGIASLLKVALQLRYRRLAPSLHAEPPNPLIDWSSASVRVQTSTAPWEPPRDATGAPLRRIGCVSSFGAGGSTAHVVLAEPESQPEPRDAGASSIEPAAPEAIVLSARTEAALSASLERLVAWLDEHLAQTGSEHGGGPLGRCGVADLLANIENLLTGTPSEESPRRVADLVRAALASAQPVPAHGAAPTEPLLCDIAYTLQVGREPMSHRIAVVATSLADLRELLRVPRPAPIVTPSASLHEACVRWLAGETVDWAALRAGRPGRLIDLPGYPFESRRHWYEPSTRYPGEPAGECHGLPSARCSVPEKVLLTTIRWLPRADPPAPPTARRLALLTDGRDGPLEAAAARGHRLVDAADVPDDPAAVAGFVAALLADVDAIVDVLDGARWRATRWRLARAAASVPAPVRWLQVVAPGRVGGADQASLVLTLSSEVSSFNGTVLATRETGIDLVARLVAEVDQHESQLLYRDGIGHTPTLAALQPAGTERRVLDPGRPYLITGGTGHLGLRVARHLVDRGARRLLLCGARPLAADPRRAERISLAVNDVRARGVEVELFIGDLAGSEFGAVIESWGRWGGVVHCAGVMPPLGSLLRADPALLRDAFEAKCGLWESPNRHRIEAAGPDFVVLFSSVAATVPALAAGAGAYAAANRYLDELARGSDPASNVVSIAWPEWALDGMAGGDASGAGFAALAEGDALAVLDLAIDGRLAPHTVVLTGDARSRLDELLGLPAKAPTNAASGDEPPAVPAWLMEAFAAVLGLDAENVEPDTTFHDLGVGSIALAELTSAIEARLDRPVAPSDLLAHPTLRQLAAALGDAPAGASTRARIAVDERAREPGYTGRLAVVGMSCRLPGADDLEAFWRNLLRGADAIRGVPPGRWQSTPVSRWGGFVDGVEDLDPAAFSLSAEQAVALDPAIRLVLEGVDACLADAGYHRAEIAGSATGIFVGARMSEYRLRLLEAHGSAGSGGDQNFIAAMASHVFDLHGPSLVVDTACSSGLTALAIARQHLLDGSVPAALVAGAEYLLDERPYLEFAAMHALSRDGRCRAFAADADGFVPGEGCVVLLVKRLADAVAAGDRIRAVIEAVAVGNDGRTMGLTTPSFEGQERVVRAALTASGYEPGDLGMVEAHGTGTAIGDPIELKALTNVFGGRAEVGSCAIGSVKSNIGHLFSAAGSAGLSKAILAVQHGIIPPTLHCDEPNPRLHFAASPFYPVTEATPWPDRFRHRVAGVSAFGLGGTNAHVIVAAPDAAWRSGRAALEPPRYARRRLWVAANQGDGDTASLLRLELDAVQPSANGAVLPALVAAVREVAPAVAAEAVRADGTLCDLGLASIDRAEVLVLAMESLGLTVPMSQFAKTMTLGEISHMLRNGS